MNIVCYQSSRTDIVPPFTSQTSAIFRPDFNGSSCFSGREQSRTPKKLQIDNFEVQYNRSGLSERQKNLHNYSEQQKVSKNRKTAEPVGAL